MCLIFGTVILVLELELVYTRKNAQVVTNLQQTCSNAVPTTCQQDVLSHCLFLACQQVINSSLKTCYKVVELNNNDFLQVVPTTCYRPAIQQFVNKLRVTTL
jgi:hypothetical protein